MENQKPTYKKVMIIDDNATDRYIATRNLQKYLFAEEIVAKESAKNALQYLESLAGTSEQLPQLIFLDIRMPEIDGFGFLEEYEKLPETVKSTCLIMMLSTSLNPHDLERAKNCKYVNGFLNKPLDKEKIQMLISKNLKSVSETNNQVK